MAENEDATLQELNSIFSSIVKRADVVQIVGGLFNFLLDSTLDFVSNLFSDENNQIIFRMYGSRAEDLDFVHLPNEFGDVDIMIFPTPTYLMICDEMIEYLAENPLHVRIKGVDHPVLQSCLVEDTKYVATSAVKHFHPSLYGEKTQFILPMFKVVTTQEVSKLLPFSPQYDLKNSITSPAATLNFKMRWSRAEADRFLSETTPKSAAERQIKLFEGLKKWITNLRANQTGREEECPPLIRTKKLTFESLHVGPRISDVSKQDIEDKCIPRNNKIPIGSVAETTLEQVRRGGFDFVAALRSPGWPKVAREWITRKREWPSPEIVRKVVQEGVHLVVKPPKNGGNPHCDFRISFSHAEYLLSREMNDIQRECYRCLKKFHRAYLVTEPKALVSFHLKNIFLQTIEETGAEMWTETNRAECMMKLFGNLLEALTRKDLPHFFVRSYNLFCADYIENPKILELLAGNVERIIKHPMQFGKDLIKKQDSKDTMQVSEEENAASRDLTLSVAGKRNAEIYDSSMQNLQERSLPRLVAATTNQQRNSSITSGYYHELKEMHLATTEKLIDVAFNDPDSSLEALDPLERSLVEDLREIGRDMTVEECRKLFNYSW